MEMNELKDHLRTDIALTMGCDPARVQLLKVEPRQVLSHGPALEVFHELDADGSGVLERSELKKAIRRLSVHGVMIEDVDALLETTGHSKEHLGGMENKGSHRLFVKLQVGEGDNFD